MPPQTIFVVPCLVMSGDPSSPHPHSPAASITSSVDHESFANLQLETPKKRIRNNNADNITPLVSFSTPTSESMHSLL